MTERDQINSVFHTLSQFTVQQESYAVPVQSSAPISRLALIPDSEVLCAWTFVLFSVLMLSFSGTIFQNVQYTRSIETVSHLRSLAYG